VLAVTLIWLLLRLARSPLPKVELAGGTFAMEAEEEEEEVEA
jgi:hypothetical protein